MTDWAFPIILACIVTVFVIVPNRSIGLERAIAIGAALFGLGALVVLVFAVGGCSKRVPSAEPGTDPPQPWCFSVLRTHKGNSEVSTLCTEYEITCERASNEARRHGRLVGIRAVGSCRREP